MSTATVNRQPAAAAPAQGMDVYRILESRTMMREMTSFARDLSGNYKVNCIIARTGQSYTSKNNIIVLDSSSGDEGGFELDARIRLLRALNIHEAYHHIETPFDEWEAWVKASQRKNPSIEQPFLNLIEDCWIEWSCSQKTPLFYRDIVWLNECFIRSAFDSVGEGGQLARFQRLLLFFLVGKEDLAHKETDLDVVKRFREAQELSGDIFKMAPFKHRLRITEDIVRLVSDWYDASPAAGQQAQQFLQFHGAPPQQGQQASSSAPQQVKPQNGSQGATGSPQRSSSSASSSSSGQSQQVSQGTSGGSPGDSQTTGSGQEEGDKTEPPVPSNSGSDQTDPGEEQNGGAQTPAEAESQDTSGDSDAAGGEAGNATAPGLSEEAIQQAQEELQRRIEELIQAAELENRQTAANTKLARDRATDASSTPGMGRIKIAVTSVDLNGADSSAVAEMVGQGLSFYQESLMNTQVGVANMRRELSILRSENPDYVTGQMTGSRVDFKRMLRGEDNFLMRRHIRENEFDPAICVMLDFSGSTDDETIQVAYRDTVLLLREFCRSAGIPLSVFGHNIGSSRVFNVYPIQFFEQEEWDPVRWVRYHPDDNARDDMAIRWGAAYLAKQQKPDKLLFVLADGEPYHPAGGYDTQTALDYNTKAVKEAQKFGVDAISIGVGVDLGRFFPKSIFVQHPNEMGKRLAAVLRNKFRGY